MRKDKIHKNIIDVGVTWIDLRTVFPPDSKWSRYWVGVCHLTSRVYMWSPLDFTKPTMVISLDISPTENYCEAENECIHFKCPLNKFRKEVFIDKFKESIGEESLGLPLNFGEKDLWFNDPDSKWWDFWLKILQGANLYPAGGKIEFSEEMWDNYEK